MAAMDWTRSGEVVALGWTLLHFCWQGAGVALLYAGIDKLTTGANVRVRYVLAAIALVLMPTLVVATFWQQSRLIHPISFGGEQRMVSQLSEMHGVLLTQVPATRSIVEAAELWIAENADRLLPWIDSVWMGGVFLMAVRALGGWWRLEQIRAQARIMVPDEVQVLFHRIKSQLRIGRNVTLRVSEEVISPLAMGVWRTTILVPVATLMQLTPAQLEAVLAHELAHVRRWDYLCNLFQTGVECVLFFHPGVWWISHRLRELREVCCDDVAARSCADPVIYVEALLQLEQGRCEHVALATTLHGNGGPLLGRVRHLLGEKLVMKRETTGSIRVGVASALLLALLVGPRVANGLRVDERLTKVVVVAPENAASEAQAPQEAKTAIASKAASLATPAKDDVAPAVEPEAPVVAVAAPSPAPAPAAAPSPAPMSNPVVAINPAPAPHPVPSPNPVAEPIDPQEVKQSGADYIQKMRDAGYPLDLNKDLDALVSMRSVGVTPEYAKAMAAAGLGTPSPHDLISLKSVGVTPEYVAQLKSSGIAPANFHEVISERSLGITPEYAKAIGAMGMGSPTVRDLTSLKAVGVTPEYVASLRASGITPKDLHELSSLKAVGVTPEYAKAIGAMGMGTPTVHDLTSLKAQGVTPEYMTALRASGIAPKDLHELSSLKAVGVTPDYAKAMADTGYPNLSAHDLVSLRAQGVTPEYAKWLKQTFPAADQQSLHKAMAFHIDADFAAKAKSHGFDNASLDKLVKLKMTGLLD